MDTNIVFFERDAAGLGCGALRARWPRGVLVVQLGERLRAVTHLDVTREEVETAVAMTSALLAGE